jgi:nucleotide-binding universal stress UspA family protein
MDTSKSSSVFNNPSTESDIKPLRPSSEDSSILLLHVFETPEISGLLLEASSWQVDYPELKKTFDAAIEQAKQKLEKVADRVREAQIEVKAQISLGSPYEEIVKVAKAEEVELIVIATHGYTGFKHFLMGSTAERVVRIAPCPVLVVREENEMLFCKAFARITQKSLKICEQSGLRHSNSPSGGWRTETSTAP